MKGAPTQIKIRGFILTITFGILMSGIQPAESMPIVFVENFNTLDATRWNVQTNGYPAPAVSVSGGHVHMGQPAAFSLDFPYVRSLISPFPASGDFSLEVGFRYTSFAGNGNGFTVLDAGNNGLGMGFWGDSSRTGFSLDFHTLEYRIIGGNVTHFLDSVVQGSFPLSARPAQIWFGHPTIGQTLVAPTSSFVVPASVDATGTVTGRWWGPGVWTTFDLDFIRVTDLSAPPSVTPVPEPSTYLLMGAGLAGLIVRRRQLGMNKMANPSPNPTA